jgi:hypothetical protein
MANRNTSEERHWVYWPSVSSRSPVSSERHHFQNTGRLTDQLTLLCSLITYYLSSVLEDMGLDAEMSRIIAGVNGTCYFLTS